MEILCKIEILTKSDEIPGSYLIDASGSIVIVISGGGGGGGHGQSEAVQQFLSRLSVCQFASPSPHSTLASLSQTPVLA